MPPPVSGDWLRHPLPRIRPRRRRGPDHSGAVGSSRRRHDHDLYACVEPERAARAESAGWHAGAARPWPKCSGLTAVCGFHLAMPIRASRAGCRVCETGTWLPSHGLCGIDGGPSDIRVAIGLAGRGPTAGIGRTVCSLLDANAKGYDRIDADVSEMRKPYADTDRSSRAESRDAVLGV
jgi:hypothetical protein